VRSDLPAESGGIYRFVDLLRTANPDGFEWRRFPFNQPLFILFSSGTTGQPKCIEHGAGGTLLEHVFDSKRLNSGTARDSD
jgi:acyl-coenzyme A synthetase/AMP-(fatty) acid ligase